MKQDKPSDKPVKADEYLADLNELRCLVLMECEEGHFHQIMLTKDTYRKLTQLTSFEVENQKGMKDGYTRRGMYLKHGFQVDADTFIGLKSIYTQKEIDEDVEKFTEESDESDE